MSGIVVDQAGRPVPNAKISWVVPVDPKPKIIAETTTDNTGTFVFKKAPGNAAEFPNFREFWRLRLDGWVMVNAPGYGMGVLRVRYEKRAVTIRLMPPQTYTAVFRDANGRPVRGLSVWGEALNNAHSFYKLKWLGYAGVTNAQGEFHAEGLPQNDSVWFQFDQSRWSVVEQKVSGSRTVYTLAKGHMLAGTVRFPDGRPVTQVSIQADPMPGTPSWALPNAYTDAEGRYQLQGLGAGQYQLRLWVPNARRFVAPDPVKVVLSEATTNLRKDITLVRAAKVTGRIIDTDGKPFSGLSVSAGSNYTVTDREGRYELAVPPGEVTLSLQGRMMPKKTRAQLDQPTTLDLTLPRNSITTIQGQVINSRGEPVPGVFVSIQGERMASGATTDNQGNFAWKLGSEEPGPLTVFVHHGNEAAVANVLPGENKPLTLRLSAENVGHLTGQVTDAAGKPIPGLAIQVTEKHMTNADYRPSVDAQGHFSILALPNIHYHLGFHAPGYGTRNLPTFFDAEKEEIVKVPQEMLSAKPGETKDLGHIVLTRGEGTASGLLRDAQHTPLALAQVLLVTKSGFWEGKTDAKGHFSVSGVVKGERTTVIVFSRDPHAVPGRNPWLNWLKRGVTMGEMGTITLTDQDKK